MALLKTCGLRVWDAYVLKNPNPEQAEEFGRRQHDMAGLCGFDKRHHRSGCVVRFTDGTAKRLPIIPGNRYLYFGRGRAEIGKFESVEFLSR